MKDAAEQKQRAALYSIFASAALTLGKLAAGLLTGSLALLSEAAHGLLDVGATLITFFAVRAADRPADETHHYGHAKIEAVAALAETGLLLVLAAGVLFEAARRLFEPAAPVDAGWIAFAVLGVSVIVDFFRWRHLSEVAAATKSDALAADAMHFASDIVSSTLVVIGLGAVKAGFMQGDTLAAAGVACFIAVAGFRLGRRTIDTLIDAAPVGVSERVRALAQGVPGVVAVDDVRLRHAGAQVLGEIGIAVSRTLPLDKVASIKEAVGAAVLAAMPEAAVTITANPRALDDESILERVLLAAALRRLPVHHVTIQNVDGRKSVSLDLELDRGMPHAQAHEQASALEAAVRAELGQRIEVETHIEPLETAELTGRDAGPERTSAIAAALAELAVGDAVLSDIHNVRVRETGAGLVVNYHCRVDARLSVARVHGEVDRLDRRLRRAFPNVARIVGHAEPLRQKGA